VRGCRACRYCLSRERYIGVAAAGPEKVTIKGPRQIRVRVAPEDYSSEVLTDLSDTRSIPAGRFYTRNPTDILERAAIPEGAQADKVNGEFKNDVVEITVPLAK
jgi:hypothetical protein